MTTADKVSLRGQLLAEIEQAEDDLAYEREKALRLAAGLREAAERIETSGRVEPSGGDFEMESNLATVLPSTFRPLFDFDGAVSLLSNLKKKRQTLVNLRLRDSLMTRRGAINTL